MEPLDLCLDLQRPPKLSLQRKVVRNDFVEGIPIESAETVNSYEKPRGALTTAD